MKLLHIGRGLQWQVKVVAIFLLQVTSIRVALIPYSFPRLTLTLVIGMFFMLYVAIFTMLHFHFHHCPLL